MAASRITLQSILASPGADGSGLRTHFQPIVDLRTRAVVAYEALTRGPAGSVLAKPDDLFDTARREGRLADLDSACRRAAFGAAAAAGLTTARSLFVNAEPETLAGVSADLVPGMGPMVLEVTERDITGDPAQLLQAIAHLRELGWSIALDDVGSGLASLALLPLVRPEVIKLDLRLVQQLPDQHAAFVVDAVTSHTEAWGAILVAEGIETEQQLDTALAMGATLGQGWLFGRAEPLPAALPPVRGLPAAARQEHQEGTPFEIATRDRLPRASTAALLTEISEHLEARALAEGDAAVVLSTFQHAANFGGEVRRRYRSLSERIALVGVIAEGVGSGLEGSGDDTSGGEGSLGRVHLAELAPVDALQGEWTVVVVAPHYSALLAARQRGPRASDGETQYEFVLTHEPQTVFAAARALALRL